MKAANSTPYGLMALIAAQSLCAAFFLWDVALDGIPLGWVAFRSSHFLIELVAALGLIAAVVVETRVLLSLLRRKAHLERQVSIAANAFHDIIEARFESWALTPSEADVAHFLVKGASISDIAGYRGSAEGTVKSQLGALYRKAGVANRGEFLSLLIEDLTMPMVDAEAPAAPAGGNQQTA